jgi:hypothetical protein
MNYKLPKLARLGNFPSVNVRFLSVQDEQTCWPLHQASLEFVTVDSEIIARISV